MRLNLAIADLWGLENGASKNRYERCQWRAEDRSGVKRESQACEWPAP